MTKVEPQTFIKKPVAIQAMRLQADGHNWEHVADWIRSEGGTVTTECLGACDSDNNPHELFILTLEGKMHVSLGDYVIRGVQGEFYPCRADIFEATYERETVNGY